jgi:NADP-reducing hydrogenase subunit HndB
MKRKKVMKLKPEDLNKISERMKSVTNLRDGAGRVKVTVHMGTCGIASGSRKILSGFLEQLDKAGTNDIIVTTSGCAGLCSREPMATVELKGEPPVKYVDLTEEKVKKIFEEHVIGGKIVTKYALAMGSERLS